MSFLEMHVYEQFDKATSDAASDSDKLGDDSGKMEKGKETDQTKEHQLRMQLLATLAEHIGDVEKVGGTQSIPYLQVIVSSLILFHVCRFLNPNFYL